MSQPVQTRSRTAIGAGRLTVSRGLTVLAALVMLLIAGATAQQLVRQRAAELADTLRQLTQLDMVFAEQTERAMETVDSILRSTLETAQVARRPPASDPETIDSTLRRRAAEAHPLTAVALADAGGQVLYASSPRATAYLSAAIRRAAAFHAANPKSGLRISEPLRLPDQSWTVLLTRSDDTAGDDTTSDSAPVIAVALLNLGYFQDFFRSLELGDKGAIVLYHRDGTVLARYPADDAIVGTSFAALPPFRDVLAGAWSGTVQMVSPVDGSPRLIAIRALRTYPLAVGISVDADQILAGWRKQILTLGLGAAVAGLSIGGLLLLLARRSRENEQLVLRHQRAKEAAERAYGDLRAQTAERERAESALSQAQRMEAIGQLTGGVAHDFNNLLTIVLGNIDLLDRSPPEDGRNAARLAAIRVAAERGATLTGQLLAFARRQRLEPRAADLNVVLAGMDGLLSSALGSHIEMRQRLEPAPWSAMVDPTQIELVILNLAINARDAMPAGGALTIETANVTLAPRWDGAAPPIGEPGPGDYVVITVRDTGHGMAPDIQAKAFEPFFTTRPPGLGSGLGLSQVLGTVQQLGGGVRIESAPQAGTTIRIYLPRAAVDAHTPAPETGPAPAGGEHATVLIVDDDAAIRGTVAELLTSLGYHVHIAEDGTQALAILRSQPEIDVLLTDVVMPVMNGPALAREAQRLRPALPVVFMSGYAHPQERVEGGGEVRLERLVHKPFRSSHLAEQLDAALRPS